MRTDSSLEMIENIYSKDEQKPKNPEEASALQIRPSKCIFKRTVDGATGTHLGSKSQTPEALT